ncbi:uncharacterized protein LOC144686213 [Cetorhinus maximus]
METWKDRQAQKFNAVVTFKATSIGLPPNPRGLPPREAGLEDGATGKGSTIHQDCKFVVTSVNPGDYLTDTKAWQPREYILGISGKQLMESMTQGFQSSPKETSEEESDSESLSLTSRHSAHPRSPPV